MHQQVNPEEKFFANRLQNLEIFQFQCCGVDGYANWYRSPRWPLNDFVPDSCCNPEVFKSGDVSENCGKMAKPNLWYQKVSRFEFLPDFVQNVFFVL